MAKDYEIDQAELVRLARLASEYAHARHDERDLANYADGIRDTLRFLAGQPVRHEPTLRGILEVGLDASPRLVT